MRKIISTCCIIFTALVVFSQQELMVSEYMFNGLFLNPGYAGSHKYFTSSLLHRTQWVNFDGAPRTLLLAVDGPISDEKMGLGFIVANDRIGICSQTDFFANYAYNIKVNQSAKLSFGIKGGASYYEENFSKLKYWDNDAIYEERIASKVVPKAGFGMYYHTPKYFAGVSIPTLLAYDKNRSFSPEVEEASRLRRHYYLNGGYIYEVNDKFKVKPSGLIKFVPSAPVQADLNLSVFYNDQLWLGLSYRTGDAIVGIIEYQSNARFRIGYAYDATTSKLNNFSAGSHEIMIGYDFGKDLVKVKTPRFF